MSESPKSPLQKPAKTHDEKLAIVLRHNYEHVLDYGFYDPIISGSIDGVAENGAAHDKALVRAANARYVPNRAVRGRAKYTLFLGRLNFSTGEEEIRRRFERYGKIVSIRLVRDLITGFSRGYAFVEFKHRSDASRAHKEAHEMIIDGREIIVEYELERRVVGWKPRRFGGGLGGFKGSGQLRFGGRAKPFAKIFRSKLSQLKRSAAETAASSSKRSYKRDRSHH